MKNCKTFYESQTHPHQTKSYHFPGTKISIQRYTEIHRHLLSKSFKNVVPGCQEMGQYIFFSDTKQKHVLWKTFMSERLFVCCGTILFSMPTERETERERAVSLMLQVWSLATYEPIKCQCCTVNQLTGFYMRETLVLNGFKMGSATSQ